MRGWVLCLLLALGVPAGGTLIARIALDVRVDDADLVVTGRIVAEAPGPITKGTITPGLVSHTTFGWEGPPKITFGTLRVDDVLKGSLPAKTVRLAYGDGVSSRELGDEGVWLLQWDPSIQAYRSSYPGDRQEYSARSKVEEAIKQEKVRKYVGPAGGLRLYARPRNDHIARDQQCEIAIGLSNSGASMTLPRSARLQVLVDGKLVETLSPPEYEPELRLDTGKSRRQIMGSLGDIILYAKQFPQPGPHSLLVQLNCGQEQLSAGPFKIVRSSNKATEPPDREWSEDPPQPLWGVSNAFQVRFSRDGRRLLTSDLDQIVGWDLEKQRPVFHLRQGRMLMDKDGALLSSDERYDSFSGQLLEKQDLPELAAVGGNTGIESHLGKATVWQLRPPKRLAEIPQDIPMEWAVSPDGGTVAAVDNRPDRLTLYASQTGEVLRKIPGVTTVGFDSHGQLLCGFDDGRVQVGEGEVWQAASTEVTAVRADNHGRYFATITGNEVILWQAEDHQPLFQLNLSHVFRGLDFSPLGDRLAVVDNSEAKVYSLPDGQLLQQMRECGAGDYLAWDNGGMRLAVSGGNAVTLWDLSRGRPAEWYSSSKSGPVYFAPTNQPVWLEYGRLHLGAQSLERKGKSLLLDGPEVVVDTEWRTLAGLQLVAPRLLLNPAERVVALSHDFAAAEGDNYGRLIDRRTGYSIRVDHGRERQGSEKIAISPDQHWLARVADEDDYVEIRELPGMQVKYLLGEHCLYVTGLGWRPDSAQLAVADLDGVKLWSLESGQLEHKLDKRLSGAVSYSPDGRYLAQGLSTDASLCLWELKTLRQVATLASYGAEWVVLAPDGSFEASPHADPFLLHVDLSKRTAELLPQLLNSGRSSSQGPRAVRAER